MSVQAIAWALGVTTGKPSAKCVLLALANYADDQGVCWPSQQRIARETEQSVDSVQRRIRELEVAGIVERKQRCAGAGRGRGRATDLYQLRMGPKPQSAALVRKSPSGPRGRLDQSRNQTGPKPQLCGLHIDEPSRTVSNKQRHPLGTGSKTFGKKNVKGDRGAMEVAVANRIGAEGFAVLMSLPDSEVDALCTRHRRGTLDDHSIERLRARASR